ncbi:MAG: TdeIII family type II restriction endonuclease [Planctomycetaceae bacterium]|jgi:hypothetical protein|nr:TdeIII family type II restriction endonuclease [Planctomycetaceae bacterium]
MTTSEKIKDAIKDIICSMMNRVMYNVLEKDPFIPEKHHSQKPIYAALVPDEIFKGSHFERRFVTPFGNVWEKLAVIAGQVAFDKSIQGHEIHGQIPENRLKRIQEVLAKLEHPEKGAMRIKPNWNEELKYILEGKGELLPATVMCDLYLEKGKNKYAFELKSPLPNSDITKVSKEKILKLYSMIEKPVKNAYFALPYNPYGQRENYNWSFPFRWFDMKQDETVMIGDEFWDFIGGKGTYQLFIDEINKLGNEYKERIYKEYLGIDSRLSNNFQL